MRKKLWACYFFATRLVLPVAIVGLVITIRTLQNCCF